MAENASTREICSDVMSTINIRCRERGSWVMCFWLAKIIRGKSQQVSTIRGVDRPSVAVIVFRLFQLVSAGVFSQIKLRIEINRPWIRVVGHSHFEGTIMVVGISIIVGTIIFNIVGG